MSDLFPELPPSSELALTAGAGPADSAPVTATPAESAPPPPDEPPPPMYLMFQRAGEQTTNEEDVPTVLLEFCLYEYFVDSNNNDAYRKFPTTIPNGLINSGNLTGTIDPDVHRYLKQFGLALGGDIPNFQFWEVIPELFAVRVMEKTADVFLRDRVILAHNWPSEKKTLPLTWHKGRDIIRSGKNITFGDWAMIHFNHNRTVSDLYEVWKKESTASAIVFNRSKNRSLVMSPTALEAEKAELSLEEHLKDTYVYRTFEERLLGPKLSFKEKRSKRKQAANFNLPTEPRRRKSKAGPAGGNNSGDLPDRYPEAKRPKKAKQEANFTRAEPQPRKFKAAPAPGDVGSGSQDSPTDSQLRAMLEDPAIDAALGNDNSGDPLGRFSEAGGFVDSYIFDDIFNG